MIKAFKKMFQSKTSFLMAIAMILCFAVAGSCFADATPTADTATVTSITTEFGNIKATALAALAALATIAVVLFGGIYAWRYAKQVFKIIAK